MTDVNTLIPADSSLSIIDVNDMNAAGDITGQAYDMLTGDMPAIEMIPCSRTDDSEYQFQTRESAPMSLPQNVRDALQKKRLHFKK